MFTLQKLNVIRIVADENSKAKLIAEGFKEVAEKIHQESTKKTTKK
jgi:hypothetical protein